MKMLLVLATLFLGLNVSAQEINYSKTVNEDLYYTNFEIIGKVSKNFMIYKRVRWKHMLAVYDKQMRELRNRRMSFIPDDANKVGFAVSPDHTFIIYQYNDGTKTFCKAVKIDDEGRRLTEPFILDSTVASDEADRFSYHFTVSEDKKRNLLYKAQLENEHLKFSFKVFDEQMKLLDETKENFPFDKITDLYTTPMIDNKGAILLTRSYLIDTVENIQLVKIASTDVRARIGGLHFGVRKAQASKFTFVDVPLDGQSIGEVKVDIDNVNRRYVLNALYYDQAANTKGLFTSFINADVPTNLKPAFNAFNDVLRKTINPGGKLPTTFNNLKLQDVTLKKNGGFIIAAEDTYVQLFKWPAYRHPNYAQNTFLQPQANIARAPSKAYDFRPNSLRNYTPSHKNVLKSIVVVDIDSALHINWNSVVNKYQTGDDPFLSYATYNTGSETHFLFSSHSEIRVVNNFSILPTGEFRKYNTVKTLASGYIFMPRSAKQVGARQLIVPAYYRGTLAFVLVDFSKNYGYEK